MPRSLIQFYALTVCFCTLMCFVVALGICTYDGIRITAPGFTLSSAYLWQSDEQFLMYYPDKKDLPAAELAALREKYRQDALTGERQTGQQGFVFTAIILVIDSVVYLVHWRIARRAEPAGPT